MGDLIIRSRELRAGDLVQVRSLNEIMDTLDDEGCLDGMPFMPEMIKFCGKQMIVSARAHKTCDTVTNVGGVGIPNTVHLRNARCDGSRHDNCQAACLLFWKDQWLSQPDRSLSQGEADSNPTKPAEHWQYKTQEETTEGTIYRCQATSIPEFSFPISPYDIRHYLEDISSRNIDLAALFRATRFSLFRAIISAGIGYRLLVKMYNWYQHRTGGSSFPWVTGQLEKTPFEKLNLIPGEWVKVKPFDEILETLDKDNKNRGLGFDTCEMRLHCGKTYRVDRRINQIIDERTGRMVRFKNHSVTLEGVFCSGETTEARLFCPRAITPYWREIWLTRTEPPESTS